MASEKKLLQELEKDTVDTSRWTIDDEAEAKEAFEIAEYRTRGGVAVPQVDGTLRAWHVTDDPSAVLELLRTKGEFYPREGDLCSGLYVSAAPHYWRGRSAKRWDFMKEISPEARGMLYTAIYDQLVDQAKSRYISASEWENAQRIVAQAMTSDYWPVVQIVADQPYNINIQQLAKDLGIAEPLKPTAVPTDFTGRYLEFNTKRAIDAYLELLKKRYGTLKDVTRADLCDMLEEYGWDGIYTQSGFGTSPELVIWNPERVIAFGDWQRTAELSGTRERVVIWDPIQFPRFEGNISISRMLADVVDTKSGERLPALTKERLEILREIINHGMIGFTAALPYLEGFHSLAKEFFSHVTRDDLDELDHLLLKMIPVMNP